MKQYYALSASLPMLQFGEAPAGMNSATFLSYCSGFLSRKDYEALEKTGTAVTGLPEGVSKKSLLYRYAGWEMSLRLSVAKCRAARLNADLSGNPALKQDIAYETDADRAAAEAYAAGNPLERERILDLARWNKLEELTRGQLVFSFDSICAYRWKLLIVEKWQRRNTGSAQKNLDAAAESVRPVEQEKISKE